MCHSLLADASLWRHLQRLDEQVAAEARDAGCPHCQGVLHGARYPRKVFGVTRALLGEGYESRLSFCCAREACRRRMTPESVRFLGRKCFPGAVVMVLCALTQDLSRRRRERLGARLRVSARTLERWRRWWRSTLPATPWWSLSRARFVPAPEALGLPASLLSHFGTPTTIASLIAALRFVAPCSLPAFPALAEHSA